MNEQVLKEVSQNLKISLKQVNTVLDLLDEGNTIPFIARYRKEATHGLDEEQINSIYKEWEYANNLFNVKMFWLLMSVYVNTVLKRLRY